MINEEQVRISPLAAAALQKNKEGIDVAGGAAEAAQPTFSEPMFSQSTSAQSTSAQSASVQPTSAEPSFSHSMSVRSTSAEADKARMYEKEREKQAYNEYVKQVTPKKNLLWQMCKAFLVGGLFCVLGQLVLNMCESLGLDKETSGSWTSLLLVLLSVILTGLHIYQCLAAWGGAGALVPITGFANSVASPAIEYKTEGQVFGIGVKIFTIAGPVILYGVFTSWLLGLIYWIGKVTGLG